jgi:hypothetical protein
LPHLGISDLGDKKDHKSLQVKKHKRVTYKILRYSTVILETGKKQNIVCKIL